MSSHCAVTRMQLCKNDQTRRTCPEPTKDILVMMTQQRCNFLQRSLAPRNSPVPESAVCRGLVLLNCSAGAIPSFSSAARFQVRLCGVRQLPLGMPCAFSVGPLPKCAFFRHLSFQGDLEDRTRTSVPFVPLFVFQSRFAPTRQSLQQLKHISISYTLHNRENTLVSIKNAVD